MNSMIRSILILTAAGALFFSLERETTAAVSPGGAPTKPGRQNEKTQPAAEQVLNDAQVAYGRGDKAQALSLINKAIKMEPDNPRCFFARARLHGAAGDSTKAIEDFGQVLRLNPAEADSYHLRGTEHFFLGQISDAVRDFNQYLSLAPGRTPHHWQRGIALYYAEQFAEGRRQFEDHQTVNQQDVENSAWHYFCVARTEGADKARALLLPVTSDSRVPMMQIQSLLAGKSTPEDVMKAAESGNASPATLQKQKFYAHLYLGLYFEAAGDAGKSREHIDLAVQNLAKDDYMGRVAMVHAKLRAGSKEPPRTKPKAR